MKTIDEVIAELTALRNEVGGDTQVFFDKNGCDDGPRSITEIEKVGVFTNEDGEVFWTSDYTPEPSTKVRKLVRIYSDRSLLFDNL